MTLPLYDKHQVSSHITYPYTLYFVADELWGMTLWYFEKDNLKSKTSNNASESIVFLELTMDINLPKSTQCILYCRLSQVCYTFSQTQLHFTFYKSKKNNILTTFTKCNKDLLYSHIWALCCLTEQH